MPPNSHPKLLRQRAEPQFPAQITTQFEGLPILAAIPSIRQHCRAAASLPASSPQSEELLQPMHFLDSELKPVSLSTACGQSEGSGLGLSREWAERLCGCDPHKRQVLSVHRLIPGPLSQLLQESHPSGSPAPIPSPARILF